MTDLVSLTEVLGSDFPALTKRSRSDDYEDMLAAPDHGPDHGPDHAADDATRATTGPTTGPTTGAAPVLHLAGPAQLSTPKAPADYAGHFLDVGISRNFSIIDDPELHFALYGHAQGRAILARLKSRSRNVVIIAPSYLKQCGIGEYGRYLSDQFRILGENVRVVRTSTAVFALGEAFLQGAMVIVNHGPGLFDGLNPRLSQGESTTQLLQNLNRLAEDFGSIPLFIHHSLIDTDHELLFSRQQQILRSNIPSLSFISSAGRNFFMATLELGVSPVNAGPDEYDGNRNGRRDEVVGFFGFFQYGGKDFDSLFHLTRELRAKLVGSVATSNSTELARFEETLKAGNINHTLNSGWVTDTELLERLQEADYFYLPQNDYDHWNNSATARFVTNIDRPLFLPPHHPFLDMADGSIFATKDDLPRIVAHFREKTQYDRAVKRVQAFRERAAMINTAQAIRDGLIPRLTEVAVDLLAGPVETSAERYLELDPGQQAAFAAELGRMGKVTPAADADLGADLGAGLGAGLGALLPGFGALYRAVLPKQFWRKHYEIGDIVFPSLNETIHATFLALTKRHVSLKEMVALVLDSEAASAASAADPYAAGSGDGAEGGAEGSAGGFAAATRQAILMALEAKATVFHDPEIVFLDKGRVLDWRTVLVPEWINGFLAAKAVAQARISQTAAAHSLAQPPITNILDLLLLPPQAVRQRRATIDLSVLDFDKIHAPRHLVDRLNVLVRECNAAGITLGDHLVLDQLQVPQIDHRVTSYYIQDFVFYEGDMFLLNAFRCLEKRDPFPLETVVLLSMLKGLGRVATLRYLLARTAGRIRISNLDDESFARLLPTFASFINNVRDPMSGLIDARNSYEVQRRNNGRWWLQNKVVTDQYWSESGGSLDMLNMLYAKLVGGPIKSGPIKSGPVKSGPLAAADGAAADAVSDIASYMTMFGHFLSVSQNAQLEVLQPDRPLLLRKLGKASPENGFAGFHNPEPIGIWLAGLRGTMTLNVSDVLPVTAETPVLRLLSGFFGSNALGSRNLTIDLRYFDPSGQVWAHASHTTVVQSDAPARIEVACPGLRPGATMIVQLAISAATSPAKLGVSADKRVLGALLGSVELIMNRDAHDDGVLELESEDAL